MAENKPRVYVELYDTPLTERVDDRTGRVLNTGSASIDDLIADALSRGTDLSSVTLRASYDLLKHCAQERFRRAQRVDFGLGIFYLEPAGVFIGDAAKWNPLKNQLIARALPSKDLRESLKSIDVEVLGMAKIPNVINAVTDVFTGQENISLTPGGMAHVTGHKIKIAGSDPTVGLKLRLRPDSTEWVIPETSIGINNPSRITFIIPTDLSAGDYSLSIVTQYTGGGTTLKKPRTLTLEYSLTVDE
ncbi:MAG: DUF4469 domain-containing protein [Tannerella sp.]|jgi:hypothetical protein|nr:DUF4469 domain-containing protein [Tannerella sp.]